ncbi:alcohol dehydrogenase catalytic domain-containing protein [Streptomyces sp. NPDC003943]
MRAIQVYEVGGPEVLQEAKVDQPRPGPGEAIVEVAASGVNFLDVYHREGRYSLPLPFTPGAEGAGTVVEVGPGVADVAVGDRVGWVEIPGTYAERAVVDASRLVPLPDDIGFETAAAVLLQGMTAHYLVKDAYRVQGGDTVLVHAAAGGMGLLLTQLITHLGGRVIGTTSTPAKAELAKRAGAAEVTHRPRSGASRQPVGQSAARLSIHAGAYPRRLVPRPPEGVRRHPSSSCPGQRDQGREGTEGFRQAGLLFTW